MGAAQRRRPPFKELPPLGGRIELETRARLEVDEPRQLTWSVGVDVVVVVVRLRRAHARLVGSQLQRPAAALVDQTADRASVGAQRVLEHVVDQVDRPPRAQVVAHHRALLVVAVVAARVGAEARSRGGASSLK